MSYDPLSPFAISIIAQQAALEQQRQKAITELLEKRESSAAELQDALVIHDARRAIMVEEHCSLQERIAADLATLGYKKPRAAKGEGKRSKAK